MSPTLVFRPGTLGREMAMLGRVIAGEIIPTGAGAIWIIRLAGSPFKSGPRASVDAARRKIEHEVREWLRAAGLDDVASRLVVRVLTEEEGQRARA